MESIKAYSFYSFKTEEDKQNDRCSIWDIVIGEKELEEYKEKYPIHEVESVSYDTLEEYIYMVGGHFENMIIETTDGLYQWDDKAIYKENWDQDKYGNMLHVYGKYIKVS